MDSRHFFSDLPIHNVALSDLLGEARYFVDVPADWHVVVTDIKNSTRALENGRNEEVNLIATGCIISTLNLAYKADLIVPFFFGGDGAMLLVPPVLLDEAVAALLVHRANTRTNFGLDLRVGAVAVADLRSEGHALTISRLHLSDVFSIPIFLGTGLAGAERIVKQKDPVDEQRGFTEDVLDLTGMECRWDTVKPTRASQEIVSLLVSATESADQAAVFKRVVDLIDATYGPYSSRNPVSLSGLRLKGTFGQIALEMRTRLGRFDLSYLLKNWLLTQFGALVFFRQNSGREYMERLIELADTLVIDGRLNTVMAGTAGQRQRLEEALTAMEEDGLLTFGLYVSPASVMSCYVRDRRDKHIHFVDGAGGGYTRAATMLKQKLEKGRQVG